MIFSLVVGGGEGEWAGGLRDGWMVCKVMTTYGV